MEAPKVVYITSSPRGGSTLLSLVLGNHPSAANLGEVSFIPKLLALDELCTCGELLGSCQEWRPIFDMIKETTHVDMRRSPYGVDLGDVIKSGGGGKIDRSRQRSWRVFGHLLRAGVDRLFLELPGKRGALWYTMPSIRKSVQNTKLLYRAAATSWQKHFVIDASKLPRKAIHLYLDDPANVRIVHLVRDGRGVTASRLKHMSVRKAAERWCHYHTITRRWLNRWVAPEHRHLLRYEDFVNEPERLLRELYAWLGMQFRQDMLQFDEERIIHSAGGNPTRFRLSEGIRGVDERWRSALTTDDLKAFSDVAGALNREFGYE